MFRTAALVLTLSGLYACVPGASPDVQSQSTSVTMIGTFVSSGGATDIYFGNIEAPIARTQDRGSFRIEIPRALIEKESDRRLYFYSDLGEAGASAEITEFESGPKTLETVQLSPTVEFSGSVLTMDEGALVPVKEAAVRVGRTSVLSDAEGRYIISAPQNANLPVEVMKNGFVITRAQWQSTSVAEDRPFRLYKTLSPAGQLSLPVLPRFSMAPETEIALYLDSTPGSAYVRVSTTPFTVAPELDGSWRSLKESVTIRAADLTKPALYYQFADKDKKAVSPVSSLPLSEP
jgi:hypothetical protein